MGGEGLLMSALPVYSLSVLKVCKTKLYLILDSLCLLVVLHVHVGQNPA